METDRDFAEVHLMMRNLNSPYSKTVDNIP